MDPRGSPWIPVDPHGSPWIPVDPHGSWWIPMDPRGSPYIRDLVFFIHEARRDMSDLGVPHLR
jgi:hypothetical protein